MAHPAPPPARPRRAVATHGQPSRRSLVLGGLALAFVLIAGITVVAVTADTGPRQDTQGQLPEAGGQKPHIIPRPGDGQAPQNPGDRGGWEQLGLFALLFVAVGGIGAVIFRGGKTTRANRARWLAAGAAGHDEALPHSGGAAARPTTDGQPTPPTAPGAT